MTAAPEPTNDLQARLEAAKAARAKLRDEQAAADAAVALEKQVALEERALRDDEARAKARREFGPDGYAVITGVGDRTCDIVILKRAHAAAFKAFQDKPESKLDDIEALVEPCVVYPDRARFNALHMGPQPGLLLRACEAVFYLAGVRKSAELGKA